MHETGSEPRNSIGDNAFFPTVLLSGARVSIQRPFHTGKLMRHNTRWPGSLIEHLALFNPFQHTWVIWTDMRKMPWIRAGWGGPTIERSSNVMMVEPPNKGYRGIAGIALAPDYFQLTSLALRQGLLSNLSLSSHSKASLNSEALQRTLRIGSKRPVHFNGSGLI